MKKQFKTQKEFLQNTFDYYYGHPERYCKMSTSCYYSPKNAGKEGISQGCAIGRHLNSDLQLKLDSRGISIGSGVTNNNIFIQLPQWMQLLGKEFLSTVQGWHDIELTNIEAINDEFREFNLSVTEFEGRLIVEDIVNT